jgi:hypothetical protein
LMPYVHEDLGGHTEGNPDPDQYVRWVQFGAFSPVARLHCTRGLTRYPWDYGEEAERIASEYIRMRYRLLPVLYAAARRAYENGTPLMRRCDLEWPGEPEAGRNKQFLFGEDLLVAPVALAKTRDIAPAPGLFRTSGGERGLSGEYFDNKDLKGDPVLVRTDTALNFVWGTGGPDPRIPSDRFSVRWTGTICPPGGDGQPRFKVVSDDGVRVWIDGTLVVDAWQDQAPAGYPITMNLEPGRPYPIRIEFYENAGGAHFQFLRTVDVEQVHQVWIPPGDWQDIWTGRMLRGPATTVLKPVLWKCPVYVRNGGIVFSVPQMQVTDEHPWNKVIVDAFVPLENASRITRILYEDDGLSPGYQNGAFCKTPVTLSRNGKKIRLAVHGMQGNFAGAISSRDWVVRLNLPRDGRPENVRIDGRSADPVSPDEPVLITETELQEDAMPFTGAGGKPRSLAGPILEMTLHQGNTREEVHVSFQLARNGTQKQE